MTEAAINLSDGDSQTNRELWAGVHQQVEDFFDATPGWADVLGAPDEPVVIEGPGQ